MRWNLTKFARYLVVLPAFALTGAQHQQAPAPVQVAQLSPASQSAVSLAAKAQAPASAEVRAQMIARGKYLVNDVALCVVCHTPKDDQGMPIAGQEFRGGIIPVRPTIPGMLNWAEHAPALGPLVGGASSDVLQLLQTGIWPRTGLPPRRPMPPFRLTEEDAKAVIAYLQSLNL